VESGFRPLPERIGEGKVLLRRWAVADAEILGRAVEESANHLRPWLAFMAEEPKPLGERKAMLVSWEEEWLRGGDVHMGVFVDDEVAGSCGLHRRRGPGTLEIGFWIHPSFTRQGLATKVARLLTDAAFAVPDIEHVEVHHDKANTASTGVPRKLGFRFIGELSDAGNAPCAVGIDCTWRMDRDEWLHDRSRELSPLRPHEFFSRSWSGVGEFVPALLGRRRARCFEFRSECEFIDQQEWIVHDTTRFETGKTFTRRMHARLVAPDRIETTADDLPEGAQLELEERGFTFRPYILKVPLGITQLRVRCRDRCWLDDRDVLHDEIEMRFLGIPFGRVTMQLSAGPARSASA
jgi:RimJ/RimL family protein N-acetyltransferase